MGGGIDGMHAIINVKVTNQNNIFFSGDCILSIQARSNYGVGIVGVSVGVSDGKGVRVSVGVAGMSVFVGATVVGIRVGVRVGMGVGVGRFRLRKTRFSA